MTPLIAKVNVKRISINQEHVDDFVDEVAAEIKANIYVDGELRSVLGTSPHKLLELGLGYILAHKLSIPDEHYIKVQGTDILIEKVVETGRECKLNEEEIKLSKNTIFRVLKEVMNRADLFKRTGCFHVAAITTLNGDIIDLVEDISRHCAFYKVVGSVYRKGIDFSKTLIVMSSRASSDLIEGITNICIPIAIFRGAPTLKSIELSDKHSITLIAHAREDRANIYTRPSRILLT
ncbi:MAG: formate dehydrogenase accessory sulfurtransferase FdhD [Ignisphaera sp.]